MGKVKKKVSKQGKKAKIKGDKSAVTKAGNGEAKKPEKKPFSGVEVYSKPGLMQPLFAGFRAG